MSKQFLSTIYLTTSALAVSLALCTAGGAYAGDNTYSFNIPAESTAKALMDFSRQANVQILFPYDAVASRSTAAISGQFDRSSVLKRLLEGSGLMVAQETDTVITLKLADPGDKSGPSASAGATTEVIVTGTHIRGGNPTSPVHVVTRADIDQSGYSQIGDVMRALPENFSGGQNPAVIGATAQNNNNNNSSGASTVNLRGLGTDATLVLVNGHRLSSDTSFQSSDISAIPMGAIDHIDVVPDGASALYGSDAVAGVVNFVLRRNFDGGEVSARVGSSADGGLERTESGLVGASDAAGYALANLEYSRQNEIRAGERDFTSGATPVTSLLPMQVRKTLFASIGRQVSDRTFVSFDALVGDRRETSNQQDSASDVFEHTIVATPSYSGALTLDYRLNDSWKLKLSAVDSGSRNSATTYYPQSSTSGNATFWNSLSTIEAVADGTLLTLPSGAVKVAIGAGERRETFQEGYPVQSFYLKADRHVSYVFGEALVPVVAASRDRIGLEALELSVSAREERYSDVGGSTTPRLGVRYVPFKDLTLRAAVGRSFKAPTFLQLYSPRTVYLFDAADLGSSGAGSALLSIGGNPALKPERSKSWTIGGDYTPSQVPGLKVSATYFDIDYQDRVVTPFVVLATAMSDPRYASFVTTAPSSADQAALIDSAYQFLNFSSGSYDPSNVVASVTDAFVNATAQAAKGVDVNIRQVLGSVTVFAGATSEKLSQRTIPTLSAAELSGTIGSVPKLKARGGVTWVNGDLTATAIVNYVSSETDIGVMPNARIGSWTTSDVNLSYGFPSTAGALKGVRLDLAVSNLFDRAPPFAASPSATYSGIRFDSTNASAVGRFVSLTVSKKW